MSYALLYRLAAALASLGLLGHTLGGMLGTAKRGVGHPEGDALLAQMRATVFSWRGADGNTWYKWWMGNGLGVSALMLPAIALMLGLAGLDHEAIQPLLPVAWALFGAFAALGVLGFRYFVARIGVVFALIAALLGAANILAGLPALPL